ncbi:MAG: thiamine transport system substrate-binding protein [Candidatus Poriferisodalaceae bacterium]|jgi:thiamine transport system substrate-binding protein
MKRIWVALLATIVVAAACSSSSADGQTLRILTHADFELPQEALDDFTTRTGIEIVVFREPDATKVVDLLSRTTETPVADVVIGFDTLDVARVIDQRLVEPYSPLDTPFIDETLLIPGDWVTPVSFIDTCLNRSISHYLETARRPDELPNPEDQLRRAPEALADLVNPEHAANLVIPNATTDRMGLFFLIALARAFPESDDPEQAAWPQLVAEMLDAGTEITDTWEEAYFQHFVRDGLNEVVPDFDADQLVTPNEETNEDGSPSIAAGFGVRAITWGSAGMPAVTVRFRPDLPELVDIEVVNDGCLRIVSYAGIVQGTTNRRDAGRFMDTVVEPLFQFTLPDRFGSRPVRTDLVRTEDWKAFGVAVDATQLNPDRIGNQWEQLRLTWTQVIREYYEDPDPVPEDIILAPVDQG